MILRVRKCREQERERTKRREGGEVTYQLSLAASFDLMNDHL